MAIWKIFGNDKKNISIDNHSGNKIMHNDHSWVEHQVACLSHGHGDLIFSELLNFVNILH